LSRRTIHDQFLGKTIDRKAVTIVEMMSVMKWVVALQPGQHGYSSGYANEYSGPNQHDEDARQQNVGSRRHRFGSGRCFVGRRCFGIAQGFFDLVLQMSMRTHIEET